MEEVDVLLVTALKEEHDAAKEVAEAAGANWKEFESKTPAPYLVSRNVVAGQPEKVVALARPTRKGGRAISTIATLLMERLKPQCLAMCGVCAGNPAQMALGDIIIGELAYAYDEGKVTKNGIIADHRQYPIPATWVRIAQDFSPNSLSSYGPASPEEARNWLLNLLDAGEEPKTHPGRPSYFPKQTWRSRLVSLERDKLIVRQGSQLTLTDAGKAHVDKLNLYRAGVPKKLPFRVRVGPIASGNVVVKDGLTWGQLKKWGVESVLGLEMEAATIGSIAHQIALDEWLVVKGVMDYADPRKDDRHKLFAARASAEVLFHLLGQLLLPRPGNDGFVLIIGATYLRGSTDGPAHERPVRQVRISNFFLAAHPVTNVEFLRFIEETGYKTSAEHSGEGFCLVNNHWSKVRGANFRHPRGPASSNEDKDNHPVVQVSWHDAIEYCKWMSKKLGRRVTLPTESQWEFAARADGIWSFGNSYFPGMANIKGSDTSRVDAFRPNSLGIYDLSGNVYEWCLDGYLDTAYEESEAEVLTDPLGPVDMPRRVLRGGSWFDSPGDCRASHRFDAPPHYSASNWGFRCSIEVPLVKSSQDR